eukprot:scaffold2723_cov108-Isochrysis_galbana.AAC.14
MVGQVPDAGARGAAQLVNLDGVAVGHLCGGRGEREGRAFRGKGCGRGREGGIRWRGKTMWVGEERDRESVWGGCVWGRTGEGCRAKPVRLLSPRLVGARLPDSADCHHPIRVHGVCGAAGPWPLHQSPHTNKVHGGVKYTKCMKV